MLDRNIIDIHTDYSACMICKKVIDRASRTADVEYVAFGQGFVQEVVKNRKHRACVALTVLCIVNIRAVLGEVVLVLSAQNDDPETVLLLCSHKV